MCRIDNGFGSRRHLLNAICFFFRPPSKVHSPYAVPLHSHRRQLSDARFCKGTPLSQRFHWYFVVGAIIVTARLEVNRQFKRKKDGDRAAISAFGFCGALSGFPFEKVGARERIVQSLYRYTTQIQPNGSGRVPHWMPVNSSSSLCDSAPMRF